MKKLHSLAFYALITPAIAMGSAASFAEEHENGDKDLGEQDMDAHAEPEDQNTERHEEATKSKYNAEDTTGKEDPQTEDQSGKQKKDDPESSDNDMDK